MDIKTIMNRKEMKWVFSLTPFPGEFPVNGISGVLLRYLIHQKRQIIPVSPFHVCHKSEKSKTDLYRDPDRESLHG
jgi:hypothetical protein